MKMNFYSVAAESESYSADILDMLIVRASSEDEAKYEAERFIRSNHPLRNFKGAEVYAFADSKPGVVGRLINTDEE